MDAQYTLSFDFQNMAPFRSIVAAGWINPYVLVDWDILQNKTMDKR
jgi:hypothetical protein